MDSDLSKLRNFLLNELSEQELIALCKDLGIDYHALAGTGLFGKTRELLITVQANDQIHRLLRRLQETKPAAFQSAGLSALRFETRNTSQAGRKTGQTVRYAIPLLLTFLLVLSVSLVLLWPREGTLQSQPNPEAAGNDSGASQAISTPPADAPPSPFEAPTATDRKSVV